MVSIKHKVTIKTKTAQEETSETIKNLKVTLKSKQPESSVAPEPTPISTAPQPEKRINIGKVGVGIVVVAAIITGLFFFANKENKKSIDNTAIEIAIQNTENKDNSNDITTAESTNEEANPNGETVSANSPELSVPANTDTNTNKESATSPSANQSSIVPVNVNGTIEEKARQVIRGDFGNGQERKDKLGASYSEIQSKVNEMYRQELVY